MAETLGHDKNGLCIFVVGRICRDIACVSDVSAFGLLAMFVGERNGGGIGANTERKGVWDCHLFDTPNPE